MSESDDPISPVDEGIDDLFGDDEVGDDNAPSDRERAATPANEGASDEELVPMDEDREEEERDPQEFREKLILDVPLYRHRIPKSKQNDGSVSSAVQGRVAVQISGC
jgi:RNA polymerase-associated protein LEO1